MMRNFLQPSRCKARAHVDQMKRVEVVNIEHNHPATVPRKIAGVFRKQKEAMKKLSQTKTE